MAVKVFIEPVGKKRILIKKTSGEKQHYTVSKENLSRYREYNTKYSGSIFSRAAATRTVSKPIVKHRETAVIPGGRRTIGRADIDQQILEDMGEIEKARAPEPQQAAPIQRPVGRPVEKVRPIIPTVDEYARYQKPAPAVRGTDESLVQAADENKEAQAIQQSQQQGTVILGEVVVIDETGEGILETTDEAGRPTAAKTQFITDPRQQGLYTPVIDNATGEQRLDYTRGRDHPRPVYRRTTAVIEQQVPQQQQQGPRSWGYSVAGRPIQMVLTVQIANESGGIDTFMGFSKTDRTSPGDSLEDRNEQCKMSALKRINIAKGLNSNDNSLMGEINEFVNQNPGSIIPRELIY